MYKYLQGHKSWPAGSHQSSRLAKMKISIWSRSLSRAVCLGKQPNKRLFAPPNNPVSVFSNRENGITRGFAGEGADADTDRKCKLRVVTVERCSWIENCIQNGASPRVIEEGGKKFRNEDAILRTISAWSKAASVKHNDTSRMRASKRGQLPHLGSLLLPN
jgi:hypothetical protein